MIENNSKIKIWEDEDPNGKGKKIGILDCNECLNTIKSGVHKDQCISCIINNLHEIRKQTIDQFSITSQDSTLNPDQIGKFTQYFKDLEKLKKLWHSIKQIIKEDCIFKEFACSILPREKFEIEQSNFIDPIHFYISIEEILDSIKDKNPENENCVRCLDSVRKKIKSFMIKLEKFDIIKEYKKFAKRSESLDSRVLYYETLFLLNFYEDKLIHKRTSVRSNKKEKQIDNYMIGENELYKIQIKKRQDENEKLYGVSLNLDNEVGLDFYEKIILKIHNELSPQLEFYSLRPFVELFEIISYKALNLIKQKYKFKKQDEMRVAYLIALKTIQLEQLFPLLVDDNIEEIFLDSPNRKIYVNHQAHGRCRTTIFLNKDEIERIQTFLRLYSNQRLDYSSPSIKFVMKNKFFYCRFSADISPINFYEFSLDIRKLNKNILTIQDLLKNETLNVSMSAFLYFNIIHMNNITAVGQTDTGKTTLINALDLLTPKENRKVYVESAVESLEQEIFDKHQVKYKVEALEDRSIQRYTKQNQIKKLLHRSPDIIYLGEILTREEAEAMFHCLSAGLKGFQTIHANSIVSLINRFLSHFKIDQVCLNDLDILVLMKKRGNIRKVIKIVEIEASWDGNPHPRMIYEYDPMNNEWIFDKEALFNTKSVQQLKDFMKLDDLIFNRYMLVFEEIFQFLKERSKLANYKLIEFFDKIAYHAQKGIDDLENFWTARLKTFETPPELE